MKDMDRAAARVRRALAAGEHIAVYGDYDVDGITSTCLLTDFLRREGGVCSLRITPQAFSARICLCTTLHAYTCSSIRMLACPSVSLHCSNNYYRYWNINQLSISYALCLGLGPDLP